MTPHPQKEYFDDPQTKCELQKICGEGYPGKNSRGEIVCFTPNCEFDTRSRPFSSPPAAPKKTWETCNQHFTCPNGEECWYLSEDFHNEEKATIRNQTLDALKIWCDGNWTGAITKPYGKEQKETVVNLNRLLSKIESLRTQEQPQHERGEQR